MKTAQDLAREAENGLSNFAGENPGNIGYIGFGDDFLNFSGGSDNGTGSFADPINQGKIYTVILTNASTSATQTCLLCPGLIRQTVGLIGDGAFTSFEGTSGNLSGTGAPNAIALFNAFIDKFPTLCAGFKVTTTNVSQMDMPLTIQKQSPFMTHDSRIITPAVYANEINPNTGLISVQESFYMDCETQIRYPLLPSTQVTLGLFFGPSLNLAYALRAKTERAKQTIAVMNVQGGGAQSSFRGLRGRS